jgi:hypothetical protein
LRLALELKLTREIKIKNIDPILISKIDRYAKSKKLSRSHVIRSLLNLQFNYSNGSLYDEHLNYRHIAKYASKQIDRNQILMKQILEILNEK